MDARRGVNVNDERGENPRRCRPLHTERSESASAAAPASPRRGGCARARSLGPASSRGEGVASECVEGKSQSVSEKQRYVGEQLKSD